jgi:branched-chain amino acid transport system substrate-binding protein
MTRLIVPRGLNRRRFLKSSVALGATVSAGVVFAPAVRAQQTAIRIGYVTPQTGPLAAFAEADNFTIDMFREMTSNGIDIGGVNYPVEVIVRDSQSSPNRAADVARELIVDEEIDLMLVASTPETTNPVSTQCELEEVPCISTMAPWEPWFVSRQANPGDPASFAPFEWTYHFFWGLNEFTTVYTDMWSQLDLKKSVGALWPNDADGNAFADPNVGFPPILTNMGYSVSDPGRFANGTESFASQISTFQQNEIEIVTGLMIPPDFTTFWTQSLQQGYRPPVCSMGRAILFPSAVDALGDLGHNLSCEVWWSANHPFVSSMNGMTSAELAASFTETTGRPWTQPIGYIHALFEVAMDVLKRTADPKDRDATIEAIAATNTSTIIGPVQFGRDNLPGFAQQNVSTTPLVGGQWRLRDDGNGYDLAIVENRASPEIALTSEMQAIA